MFTPSPRLTVTIDAYQIDVKDRIGYSQTFNVDTGDPVTTAARRAQLRALGVANWATLGEVQFFTNGFATRTKGIDFVVNHNVTTDFGRFQTTLAGNVNRNKVTQQDPGILSPERIGNIENQNPKFRTNLTETWTLDRFNVVGRAAFYGKCTSFNEPVDGGVKSFGSEFTFDLELAYQITDNIRLAVGGENILNNYPDKDFRAAGTANQNFYTFTKPWSRAIATPALRRSGSMAASGTCAQV